MNLMRQEVKCQRCGRETGPCSVARVRARERRKRCYELAGRGICENDAAQALLLVHGVVRDPKLGAYPHAWVLDPATRCVYDPVLDRCFTESEYKEQMSAHAERTYPYAELCKITGALEHWGPWHDRPIAQPAHDPSQSDRGD